MIRLTGFCLIAVLAVAVLSGPARAQESNALRGIRQIQIATTIEAEAADRRHCRIGPEFDRHSFNTVRAAIADAGPATPEGLTTDVQAAGGVTMIGAPPLDGPMLIGVVVIDRDGDPQQCVGMLQFQLALRVPGVRVAPDGDALDRRLIFWIASDVVVSPAERFAALLETSLREVGQLFVRSWQNDNP